ncbi:tRNA-U20-dihydrouridine synthase [Abditibacterium utsteinense]|uniref:tRNA-dihydrouridine synthase n=1 Tax=Abditibacterium utsteinense TaxID=1960156 RepID=A0A2S8ST10_9BACT|nr:tRNA dihydrouridine synthase DusB [Abditibacterium utsteinense]PQV63908.1 tRNA-U20-dihydrouridine synthase [Abditibacterium utsteinense]
MMKPMILNGNIVVETPVVLAPMAGITSEPFRRLCRRYGAGMSWSELVSSAALVMGGEKAQAKSRELAWFSEEERPVAVQIFGANPDMMREAALKIAATKPDAIDINMGCAVPKIAKCGAGCLLLKTPQHAEDVIRATVEGASQYGVPVTVKMRAGWDAQNITAPEVAKRAQDVGAVAITVHPRTAKQAFTGHSDWSVIARVKESVSIPVIGCGDVHSGPDAAQMFAETGCDAVMIGRAAMGNPFLFADVKAYLESGADAVPPTGEEKIETARWHARELCELKGEHTAMNEMRKHAAWYTKGMPESARLRDRLCRVSGFEEMEEIFADALAAVARYGMLAEV